VALLMRGGIPSGVNSGLRLTKEGGGTVSRSLEALMGANILAPPSCLRRCKRKLRGALSVLPAERPSSHESGFLQHVLLHLLFSHPSSRTVEE